MLVALAIAAVALLVVTTWRARAAGRELRQAALLVVAAARHEAQATPDAQRAAALEHEALVLYAEATRPNGPNVRAIRSTSNRITALMSTTTEHP